jgi:integrase
VPRIALVAEIRRSCLTRVDGAEQQTRARDDGRERSAGAVGMDWLELRLQLPVGSSVPLIVIQRQLGHSNLGITSIYRQGIDNAEIIETVQARASR